MTRLRALATLMAVVVGVAPWGDAHGQCILANPSFELVGGGGQAFMGWNQFGAITSVTESSHGSVAARVFGPDSGNWDVAGLWQRFDTSTGRRWSASVVVSHPASQPLAGQARALLNIEWRDASENLISYETHTVADASTPPDRWRVFEVTSAAAPAGTASVRLVLGVLQGPDDPTPAVDFDQATFVDAGPPTLEDKQWVDFPGGRTISFSDRTWRVKGPGFYGPGPSAFSDDPASVWVDANGRLHLTIRRISNVWNSTEVTLEEPLGYGDYVFTTRGRLDQLDRNAVLGLFIWEYGPCYDPAYLWWNPYNEIDVEFSRWGQPANDVGQFVAQPYDFPGNIRRFAATFTAGEVTSHAFRWLPDRVEYRSWRGGPDDEAISSPIQAWTYAGPHIPRPEHPRVHINLWQFSGPPLIPQEVVLDAFTFTPACGDPTCGALDAGPGSPVGPRPGMATPNPFALRTTIAFTSKAAGHARVSVFDLGGRRVRTLLDGPVPAGPGAAVWDGRGDDGYRLPPGVYLCRIEAPGLLTTRRLVLVR